MSTPILRLAAALLVLLAPLPAAAEQPTAEQILGRALQALGGEKRLSEIETREATGRIEVSGLVGEYSSWGQADNKLRIDIDLKVIRVDRAFDGTSGWERRNDIVAPLVGAALAPFARSALFNPLLSYRESAVPVTLAGRERVGDREAWVLEFTPAAGSPERFYIDTETSVLLQETRTSSRPDGDVELVISYSDYRRVEGVMVPFSIITERPGQVQTVTLAEYRVNQPQPEGLYENPAQTASDEPYQISLASIPRRVFKENDGVWGDIATESWVFHVVVNEAHGRLVEPVGAVLELFKEDSLVHRVEFSKDALEARRAVSFTGMAGQEEIFDLRHHLSEPVGLEIDRLVYQIRLVTPAGEELEQTLEIPLSRYQQRTELIFPLRGHFIVAGGHAFNDDHKGEWSQHYADDILALGDHYELLRGSGAENDDYVTWDAEVIAPAAGTVVYARDDVPDNSRPGEIELQFLQQLPDPINAVAGNNVIIDHGNGEFSFLAHLKQGSVRVQTGDRVRQGSVLGRVGNSGNSDAPHLHYHLMAGPLLMRSDGLPARFDNVFLDLYTEGGTEIPMPTPKRGIPLVARPPQGTTP